MAHVFEAAPTGRAKCRGCNRPIDKGEVRFGERLPNAFGEGEMTQWFHPLCAAYKRPEAILEALAEPTDAADRETLERVANTSLTHRRLARVDGAQRAPSGQARCRQCKEPIAKGAWRIRLVFYEEGRFSPGGFIHLHCRAEYFENHDPWDALMQFSPDLTEEDREDLSRAYRGESA